MQLLDHGPAAGPIGPVLAFPRDRPVLVADEQVDASVIAAPATAAHLGAPNRFLSSISAHSSSKPVGLMQARLAPEALRGGTAALPAPAAVARAATLASLPFPAALVGAPPAPPRPRLAPSRPCAPVSRRIDCPTPRKAGGDL